DQPRVGGKDEIGHSGPRRHQLDLHAEIEEGFVQVAPLLADPVRSRAAGPAHPRVDFVFDPVVIGRAHQDAWRFHDPFPSLLAFSARRVPPSEWRFTASAKRQAGYCFNSVTSARRNGSASVTTPTV